MAESAAFREAIMEDSRAVWSDVSEEEELVRELLDDGSPLFMLPQVHETNNIDTTRSSSSSSSNEQSNINKLISNIYSGPTISDIENALSVTSRTEHFQDISAARVSILERSLSKIENKYTLKVKCFGNGLGDDGYKWRKYGQKSIKNSRNPRSYYRCTNPRCSAKKQVEKSNEDPDTLIITYEGLHLHFAYPYFAMSQQQQSNPPTKKPKIVTPPAQAQDQQAQHGHVGLHIQEAHETLQDVASSLMPSTFMGSSQDMAQENMGPQGLLEDMVPLMIRKPANNSGPPSLSCSSYRSLPTSPPLSWSSNYSSSCYTVGLNSSFR